MKQELNRFIPDNSIEIINVDANAVVYIFLNLKNQFCAIGYSAKRKNKDFYYLFQDEKQRNNYINEFFTNKIKIIQDKIQYKIDQKIQNDKLFEDIKIGDIFVSSWGYEQTNVNAVQLVELKGKTQSNARVSAFMRNVEANQWLIDPDLNIIKGSNKNKNGKLSDFTLYAKQWQSKAEDEDM